MQQSLTKYLQTQPIPHPPLKIQPPSRLGCENCRFFEESFLRLPCGNCIQYFYPHKKHNLDLGELLTQGFLLGKKGIRDLSTAHYVWDKTPRKACYNPENNFPLCGKCGRTYCKERIYPQINGEITSLPKRSLDTEVILYGYGTSYERIDPMIEIFVDDGSRGYGSCNQWMWGFGDTYASSKTDCIRDSISRITYFHIAYRRKNGRLLFEGRYFRDHVGQVTGKLFKNRFHKAEKTGQRQNGSKPSGHTDL